MNKTELVAAVAEKTGLTKKDAEKALCALIETVKEEVAKNEKVQLIGFGTFEARKRNARTGKNPQSGEAIEIPAANCNKMPGLMSPVFYYKPKLGRCLCRSAAEPKRKNGIILC